MQIMLEYDYSTEGVKHDKTLRFSFLNKESIIVQNAMFDHFYTKEKEWVTKPKQV